MKPLLLVLALLALTAGAGAWYWEKASKPAVTFRTADVRRGELLATISATGTIEPEESIDVGAQVGGKIDKFGIDADGKSVDYNSRVEAGKLMAHIDESLYTADLETANAQVLQANATLLHDQADLNRLRALLDQAKGEWARAEKLGPSDALSQNDYDTYKANFATAQSNLKVGEAAVEQSKAGVASALAALHRAQANVNYCQIYAPVNGVVIDRRVNIGQTVVSGLSAPSLFLIAKDLSKMQIWVAVNEADIGSIHPGQNVTFTVDAAPGETFQGKVNKVRLNATMTQNVVTYTVEVNTDNSSGKLKPYLTANVHFEVKKDEDVLLVPNAALRWYPQVQEVAPDVRAQVMGADDKSGAGPPAPAAAPATEPAQPRRHKKQAEAEKAGTIWVKDGQWVRPISVTVGPNDGSDTEVASADLKEGASVIVGEVHPDDTNQTTNPFAPQMFRNRRGGGGGGRGR